MASTKGTTYHKKGVCVYSLLGWTDCLIINTKYCERESRFVCICR